MSPNLSRKQHPTSAYLSPKEGMNFPLLRPWMPTRRRAKWIANTELKILWFVAVFAGLMLGRVFAVDKAAHAEESAPPFFNLGNALAREGKPGPAILAFERAQQLAPRDPAIAVNLQAVRDAAALAAPTAGWWQSAARMLTMNEWAWSGSLALAFVCGALAVGRFIPSRWRQTVNVFSAACAVAVLVAASALWIRWPELGRAVVVNSRVTALIAPAESAGPVFPLAEGEIVTVVQALRNFALVRTADARSGWVARGQIERIIPAPAPDHAG
jgi:hypothetical protein